MAKRDPALLKLVREAFMVLGENTEAMNRLNTFVENQEKKIKNRMRKLDFSSLRSIYSKLGSDSLSPDSPPAKKQTTK